MIAYCKELNQAIFTTGSAVRSVGSGTLDVSAFGGQTIETWISFVAADGTVIANSLYTGELNIS